MNRTRTAATLAIPVLALSTLTGCTPDPVDQAVEIIEEYSTHRDASEAAEYLGKHLRDGSRAEEGTESGPVLAKMNIRARNSFRAPAPADCEVTNPDEIADPVFKSRTAGDFYLIDEIRFVCGDNGEYTGEGEVELQKVGDDKYELDDVVYLFDRDSEKPPTPEGFEG